MEGVSLKEQKEAFVTGHDGGTPWEVLMVCLSAPICLACYRSLTATVRPHSLWAFVTFEAVLVWFPMVLSQTTYLFPYGMVLLATLARTAHIFGHWALPNEGNNDDGDAENISSASVPTKLDYLTAYRSSILYLTFIAILAVDFHVFPRRYCKTEVAGYGLMDIGAASFCLSAGLVSPRARGRTSDRPLTSSSFVKPMLHTLPLVLLGLIRIVTNRELEYQEHVSEYGVHWNFFFTMGILALVPPLISSMENSSPRWWKPAIIMGIYQAALSLGGLQEFIELAPRHCTGGDWEHASVVWSTTCNIFAANREGILGCLGYLSLFFFGEWVGYEHIWKTPSSSWWLWKMSALLWTLLAGLSWGLDIPVSRRSTNGAFCVWAAAHNIVMLAFLQWSTVESNCHSRTKTVPIVWDTVNRYGLLMFLIANLLTGLVNLTVPTLEMSDPVALLIVFLYICAVGMAALLLDELWTRVKQKPKAD